MAQVDTAHVIRRLPYSDGRAETQLSAGAALLAGLEQSGTPALRWYRIDPPALLLGSSQQLSVVDAETCARQGLSVYRRRSGGGVVLGDETLLMLDLALPREHALFTDNVTESYRWIGEVWVTALSALGINARTVSIGEARADRQTLVAPLKQVCFGGLSPYESVVENKKVVGLAQLRRRFGALFQCAVHLRWNPQHTAMLMAATPLDQLQLTQQLSERVAGLSELTDRSVNAETVIASFELALAQLGGLRPVDSEWSEVEQAVRVSELGSFPAVSL